MSLAGRLGSRAHSHPFSSALITVIVLGGAAAGVYFGIGDGTAAAATATVRTETVATGTVRQSVSATGTLAPAQNESLNFAAGGVVTAVNVTEGQSVTKGQALATINSASLAAAVAQAQATVASNQAKVDSDEDNDVSSTQLAADQAALAAAQNQLASAQAALAGATLVSPIDGVVAAVNLSVGQSVAGSGAGSASSAAQIQVISTNTWIVNATVDATSVGLIKVGNQAQLTVAGASGTVYGTISSIAILSSSTTGTASYPVVVTVTGAQTGLHSGAGVTATLIYKQVTDVVVVSPLALHRNTDGTQYVEKLVNGKPEKTTVQVGISSGGQTEITSGLAAGDQIQVQQLTVTTPRTTTTGSTRNGNNGNAPGGGTFNFPGGGNFQVGGNGPGGAAPGGANNGN